MDDYIIMGITNSISEYHLRYLSSNLYKTTTLGLGGRWFEPDLPAIIFILFSIIVNLSSDPLSCRIHHTAGLVVVCSSATILDKFSFDDKRNN